MNTVTLEQFDSIGHEMANFLRDKFEIEDVNDFLFLIQEKKIDHLKYRFEQEKLDTMLIDKWVEIIDLFRIPTMSAKEAEMLQAININSIEELSHRDPVMILNRLRRLDEDTYFIILDFPSVQKIESWIYYAKLMTRNIIIGYAYPLIAFFPLVKIENVKLFQRYQIWTVEDFMEKFKRFPKLRQLVEMDRDDWNNLINFIDIVRVDGIQIYSTKLLIKSGIKTLNELKALKIDEAKRNNVYEKIRIAQSEMVDERFIITKEGFMNIIENAQEEQSIREMK
jgi:hypothetical protein